MFVDRCTKQLYNGMHLATTVAEEEEQAVGDDEQEGDDKGVEVFVGSHEVADIYDELQQGIAARDIQVRYLEVVDHGLVGVLAVCSKDIAT